MAVAEIKLTQITMQVGFADVLVDTVNTALENREEAFDSVGSDDPIALAAHVFVSGMFDGSVRREVPADAGELAAFIGHEVTFRRSVAVQNRVDGFAANGRHVEGPRGAVALDQRQNRIHVAVTVANFGS